jgi:predicted PurR-regulated permease PerM
MADPAPRSTTVHPTFDRLAAYGWRSLVLAAVGLGLLWLLGRLWVIVLALVVALYIVRILDVPATWLRGRGLPPAIAALLCLAGFLGGLYLIGALLAPIVADQFESLSPTLSDAVEDVERWLVEDSPFELDKEEIDDLRQQAGDAIGTALRSSSGSLVSGALVAFEAITGVLLALVTTFFLLKDAPRFQQWFLRRLPAHRRPLGAQLGRRAWVTLGGYLKGVALLGSIEAAIIGITVAVVGGELAWPVALVTFAAAFVPIVGAIVAGAIAVLVTLATAGTGPALVVTVVAIGVQQLDNDLLAPVVYGRSLQLHPLVVLFAVVGGGALFGFAGTVLAVPVTAVIVNVVVEARAATTPATPEAPAVASPPGG